MSHVLVIYVRLMPELAATGLVSAVCLCIGLVSAMSQVLVIYVRLMPD